VISPHFIVTVITRLRRRLSHCLLLGLTAACAHGACFTYTPDSGFANGGTIPDGDLNGWQHTCVVSDIPDGLTIVDIRIILNISGGCNGDLYGTLQHDSGFAVLLNRPGKTAADPIGYCDPGFDIVIDDSTGTPDIHLYHVLGAEHNASGQVLGTWHSDGRSTHPSITLDTDPRTTSLDSFRALDPNGTWTLFLADTSLGGESTVNSWTLEIVAVPEPEAWIPAFLLLGAAFIRRRRLAGR